MTIVNVGANNGLDQCLQFVLKNLDKVDEVHLIEPSPECLEECRKNYGGIGQAKFHNLAMVSDNSNWAILYRPKGQPLSGHSSINREHLFQHGHSLVEGIDVKAMSLGAFLDSLVVTKCDRLYIDTEGLDCQIILTLDVAKYGFDWIEFENIHADGPMNKGENYSLCVAKLKALGYSIKSTTEYNEAAYKC